MPNEVRPVITRTDGLPRDRFEDPSRGNVGWFTLISGDLTPTDTFSAGIAEFQPRDGILNLHRHDQAEIYYIIDGAGIMTIDGVEQEVMAGATVFIPGNAEHGIRNTGDAWLRLFYIFATDRFGDVVYRFPEA